MSKKVLIVSLVALIFSSFGFSQRFTTFSFRSDDTHDGPVFTFYNGTSIEAKVGLDLMVDVNDDNGGGQITFQSTFVFRGEAYDYMVVPCGSNWLHVWKVKADMFFDHFDATVANRLLSVYFQEATLTSISPSPSRVGQTLTLQVSESADPSLTFKPDTILIGAGVDPNEVVEREDLAFTFTKTRGPNFSQLIPLSGGKWKDDFTTESSFSASGSPN